MHSDSEQPALFGDTPVDSDPDMQLAMVEILLQLDTVQWSTDAAAVQLVWRYAQLLDEARGRRDEVRTYATIGPRLLAALGALGWTAAGRATGGGANGEHVSDALSELRKRRQQRQG